VSSTRTSEGIGEGRRREKKVREGTGTLVDPQTGELVAKRYSGLEYYE
jgi:hypothetical protein